MQMLKDNIQQKSTFLAKGYQGPFKWTVSNKALLLFISFYCIIRNSSSIHFLYKFIIRREKKQAFCKNRDLQ